MKHVQDKAPRKFTQFAKRCPVCSDIGIRARYYCNACLAVAKQRGHESYRIQQEKQRLLRLKRSQMIAMPCKHCGLRIRLCSDGLCSVTCREAFHENQVPVPKQRGFLLSDVHRAI